jgi:hypothetical protein
MVQIKSESYVVYSIRIDSHFTTHALHTLSLVRNRRDRICDERWVWWEKWRISFILMVFCGKYLLSSYGAGDGGGEWV